MHWHHSALSSRPQVLQSVTQWRPQEKETKYKTFLSAAGVLKVIGVKNKNRKNVIPSWSSSWQCVEVGHSEVKHRRNCKSCPTQVTWKIKFWCQICLCCLLVCPGCPDHNDDHEDHNDPMTMTSMTAMMILTMTTMMTMMSKAAMMTILIIMTWWLCKSTFPSSDLNIGGVPTPRWLPHEALSLPDLYNLTSLHVNDAPSYVFLFIWRLPMQY